MKTALIGYTGFVGNFLLNKLSFNNLYNSKNINDIRGQEFDLIICCGISAKKWEANKNPEKDLENINLLSSCLEDVKCARFILISSIDVYPNINSEYTEDYPLTEDEQNHAYGKNRLLFEKYVKDKYKNHHIIRFPGLFGYGLKKNIIFDLLNKKPCAVNLKSKYQWYDLSWIFNDDEFSIKNIEIAPSKFFGENFISQPLHYFDKWKNGGIYSIQSLLYPHKNNIFSDKQWFIGYVEKIAAIAKHIGAKVLVFGSPQNRIITDTYNYSEAIESFRKIGIICGKYNVIFCIENNASLYGCNFLTTSDQVIDFVKKVRHPNIRAVLDVGCSFLENEDIYNKLVEHAQTEWVSHIHISAPNLVSLGLFKDIRYKYLYDKFSKVCKKKITLELSGQEEIEIKRSIYMLRKIPSIAIVGSGWYGAHIGIKMLEKGYNVSIYEKNNKIFNGASSFNQNRLHLGFHYPRSFNTRKLCKEGYDKFIKEYGFCVHDIKNNIYLIAKESLVDYKTYLGIYNYEGINYRLCEDLREFNNIQVGLMTNFNGYNVIYELTLSLLYKSDITDTAYTIMDGQFGSVYPFDVHNNIYSLTNAKYTPLIKTQNYNDIINYTIDENHISILRDLMEKDITKYMPNFLRDFKFYNFFVSYKCKINNPSDMRELIIKQTNNISTIACGKITRIFELDDSVL